MSISRVLKLGTEYRVESHVEVHVGGGISIHTLKLVTTWPASCSEGSTGGNKVCLYISKLQFVKMHVR